MICCDDSAAHNLCPQVSAFDKLCTIFYNLHLLSTLLSVQKLAEVWNTLSKRRKKVSSEWGMCSPPFTLMITESMLMLASF